MTKLLFIWTVSNSLTPQPELKPYHKDEEKWNTIDWILRTKTGSSEFKCFLSVYGLIMHHFIGLSMHSFPVLAMSLILTTNAFHIVLFYFPLSSTAMLEPRAHISVIQAHRGLHQQQQCYASPVDSFHFSILCFFPFSSLPFLPTWPEDAVFTLLGYQDAE